MTAYEESANLPVDPDAIDPEPATPWEVTFRGGFWGGDGKPGQEILPLLPPLASSAVPTAPRQSLWAAAPTSSMLPALPSILKRRKLCSGGPCSAKS